MMSTNAVSTDKTGEKQSRWKPGQSGNPAGRPKGARSKLSEAFLKALSEDFATNGTEVIEKVRNDRPQHVVADGEPLRAKHPIVARHVRRSTYNGTTGGYPEAAKNEDEEKAPARR